MEASRFLEHFADGPETLPLLQQTDATVDSADWDAKYEFIGDHLRKFFAWLDGEEILPAIAEDLPRPKAA